MLPNHWQPHVSGHAFPDSFTTVCAPDRAHYHAQHTLEPDTAASLISLSWVTNFCSRTSIGPMQSLATTCSTRCSASTLYPG